MLEYIEPRHLIPLACQVLAIYHNTTEDLLPAFLHAASGRRLQLQRGKLQFLSRQRSCWIDENGKAKPYVRRSAFSIIQRVRYPIFTYTGYCITEGCYYTCFAYDTPTTCPNDPKHLLGGAPTCIDAEDITPSLLTLQPTCEAKVIGKVPYTLHLTHPVIDIISTAVRLFVIDVNGRVHYARNAATPFSPSVLHGNIKFVEVVAEEGCEGIFTAGITFDNKLMVRGSYRNRYYPIFCEVSWPE
jgi:hypothetical protein